MPGFILIHPTVWPQYTKVTGKQDRNGTRTGTVLQTVAQKVLWIMITNVYGAIEALATMPHKLTFTLNYAIFDVIVLIRNTWT